MSVERRHGGAAHAAKIHARRDDHGIEQAALRKAFGGELLEADAERKHGHERGHADGDAECRKRIAQNGFAKIAQREIAEVAGLHRAAPFESSLPSPMTARRSAKRSASGRSWVTMTMVMPGFF